MSQLRIEPVTADRWDDLVVLFGDRGASSGCWCMWFRATPRAWTAGQGAGNRAALLARVEAGEPVGLLAYDAGVPVGWVSVAPRSLHERIAAPGAADPAPGAADAAVWSMTCFYVAPGRRGAGVATALVRAAVDHAFRSGASAVEAYPVEPAGRLANGDAFTGPRSLYEAAGFREVGRFDRWRAVPAASGPDPVAIRRPPGRPVMCLPAPVPGES